MTNGGEARLVQRYRRSAEVSGQVIGIGVQQYTRCRCHICGCDIGPQQAIALGGHSFPLLEHGPVVVNDHSDTCHQSIVLCFDADGLPTLTVPATSIKAEDLWLAKPIC